MRKQLLTSIDRRLSLVGRNNRMIQFCSKELKQKSVNLNFCNDPMDNIGDALSPVICNYLLKREYDTISVSQTKHLFAVGSIISFGHQDATVWGSGLIDEATWDNLALDRKIGRKLDIRAVRGPETRKMLMNVGYSCPEVYGDPAVIMPDIYTPQSAEKKYEVSWIIHCGSLWDDSRRADIHRISVRTGDYQYFIDEIAASKKIVSSSLHGIILAEAYGVPAVLILDDVKAQAFKFYDWYYATDRREFAIASSVEAALKMEPTQLPDLDDMRQRLKETFPYDIFSAI